MSTSRFEQLRDSIRTERNASAPDLHIKYDGKRAFVCDQEDDIWCTCSTLEAAGSIVAVWNAFFEMTHPKSEVVTHKPECQCQHCKMRKLWGLAPAPCPLDELHDLVAAPVTGISVTEPQPHESGCLCSLCRKTPKLDELARQELYKVPPLVCSLTPKVASDIINSAYEKVKTLADHSSEKDMVYVTEIISQLVSRGLLQFHTMSQVGSVPSEEELVMIINRVLDETEGSAMHVQSMAASLRRQLLERQPKRGDLTDEECRQISRAYRNKEDADCSDLGYLRFVLRQLREKGLL